MKLFFITFLAMLSALLALFLVLPLIGYLISAAPEASIPDNMILTLKLDHQLREAPTSDSLSKVISDQALSVPEIVSALKKAASDKRVSGLRLVIGTGVAQIAQVQEIRDAIATLKRNGKFALAYAQQFDGRGLSAYYLAAACDEIWLQTTSELHVTGISVATPFIKETLSKVGIVPQFGYRHEYKTATHTFTETDFTVPHRESLESLLDSTFETIATEIGQDRGFGHQKFVDLVNKGPYTAQDAVTHGLVDRLGYEDEYRSALLERAGGQAEFITLRDYLENVGGAYDTGATIAVIYGVGTIVPGESSDRGRAFSQGATMGGDTIVQAFQEAAEDPDIKSIVFRVSSPGGSYLASDQIWRAVIKAREAGKPVVATMGATAASGGYFVAMAADEVFAQPGTLTGSIGVLGGKLVTSELLQKLGIRLGEISVGKNAAMQSTQREYTPEQWQWINRSLDRIYNDFTGKAAQARNLSAEQIDRAARGRIWSGTMAREIGLVDELGGFAAAVESAKKLGGIESDAPVELKQFPRARTFSEQLLELMNGASSIEKAASLLQSIVSWTRLSGANEAFTSLGSISGTGGVLTMPPIYELP